MSELSKLKELYVSKIGNNSFDGSYTDLVDKYFSEEDPDKRDIYISQIIVHCWPALEKMCYKQSNEVLSEVDCYDIFMDSLQYVLEKRVWNNPESSIYKDKDAVLKCMYVVTNSRRKGYFTAQNRHKRKVNQFPLSLDSLSEEFQEGYFSPVFEKYNFERGWESKFISRLWEKKLYVSAIILDIILNLDVFEGDSISKKKIKKYVKNFDLSCYNSFIERYKLDSDEFVYNDCIQELTDKTIYAYIDSALNLFKTSDMLQEIKQENVN